MIKQETMDYLLDLLVGRCTQFENTATALSTELLAVKEKHSREIQKLNDELTELDQRVRKKKFVYRRSNGNSS